MREGQQLKLQFRVPTDVSVTFQRHPYTGLVSVSWNGNETILHNYAEKGSFITENADWPVERQLDRKPLGGLSVGFAGVGYAPAGIVFTCVDMPVCVLYAAVCVGDGGDTGIQRNAADSSDGFRMRGDLVERNT